MLTVVVSALEPTPTTAATVEPEKQVDEPQASVSNTREPEYIFHVDFVHAETGEKHTEEIRLDHAAVDESFLDGIGPTGTRGREIALRVATERVGLNYIFAGEPNSVRFDMGDSYDLWIEIRRTTAMTDTPQDVFAMTPEQATAKLAELQATYNAPPSIANLKTPEEAKLKLESLSQNKGWYDQLMAGDAAVNREFKSLSEMAAQATDRLDNVLNGKAQPGEFEVTTPDSPISTRDPQTAVDGLREGGIGDDVIREIMSDRKASKAEHEAAKEFQRKHMGDAEWVKRLLGGGHDEQRELTLGSAILNTPVED